MHITRTIRTFPIDETFSSLVSPTKRKRANVERPLQVFQVSSDFERQLGKLRVDPFELILLLLLLGSPFLQRKGIRGMEGDL